jgi:hypothetical protein
MSNEFKQTLVGKRVNGIWASKFPYTGTIVESIPDKNGEDFNHIIKLDCAMSLTWIQLGYGERYKRYKPWVYTHLNHDTESAHLGEPGRHVVELINE